MFLTLASGLGHCIQPVYRALVAIEEVCKVGAGRSSSSYF